MAARAGNPDQHVGELLPGYVDGEMTQQERQGIEIHCAQCDECELKLRELTTLRDRVSNTRSSEYEQGIWKEVMDDSVVGSTRGIGWLIFTGLVFACAGVGVFAFLFSSSISPGEKLIVSGIYLGLALLFLSVLRQRLNERNRDKHNDVEI